MSKNAPATPVRAALKNGSTLLASVVDGLGAVKTTHRGYFDEAIRSTFGDSLDLDAAMVVGHESESRWDYLLGHTQSAEVVAVEPHSAKHDEITTVIRKRTAARYQLRAHLRDGAQITKWLWVASGKVHFADTERVRRLLDQNGIEFVGTRVKAKHLPLVVATSSGPTPRKRRNTKQ